MEMINFSNSEIQFDFLSWHYKDNPQFIETMAQSIIFTQVSGEQRNKPSTKAVNGQPPEDDEIDTDEEELEKSLLSYEQFDNRFLLWRNIWCIGASM